MKEKKNAKQAKPWNGLRLRTSRRIYATYSGYVEMTTLFRLGYDHTSVSMANLSTHPHHSSPRTPLLTTTPAGGKAEDR